MNLNKGTIEFFSKNKKTWESWFSLLAKRYFSYGTFGGYVNYEELGAVDLTPIKEFLGLSQVEFEAKNKFSIKKFIMRYNRSALAEKDSLENVIEYFIEQSLITKEKLCEQETIKRKEFDTLVDILLSDKSPLLVESTRKNLFEKWKDDQTVIESLEKAQFALNHLPNSFLQLPYFSNQLFHNAHELDTNSLTGEIFNSMLRKSFELSKTTRRKYYSKVELSEDVYTHVKLLRGDHTIYAFVQGIYSNDLTIWNAHAKERDSWIVRKGHVLNAKDLYTKNNKVFVVENDGVFQMLTEMFPNLPFLSTSGQPNYTVLKIVEKLVISDTMIYYSGDLDPNGLSMAQNILKLYPLNVKLVGMDAEIYSSKLKTKELTKNQIKLLDSILVPDLQDLKYRIYLEQKAVEQEALTESYIPLLEEWDSKISTTENE